MFNLKKSFNLYLLASIISILPGYTSLQARRLADDASECTKKCYKDCFMSEKIEDKDKCTEKEERCLEECQEEVKKASDDSSEPAEPAQRE